jgi:dipeptidyl aminopeptidase/acylaminoacyl peptidase
MKYAVFRARTIHVHRHRSGAVNRIAAADFEQLTQVEQPRVAPDGDRVAFVRKTPDDEESYESTVYLAPTGGGEPQRFTISEGTDSEPRFSPTGDRLAVVSTRGAGDDRPQLWVIPTGGGEGRQVTNVAGGVSNIAWSPDGERVAFVQQVGDEEREGEHDIDAEGHEPAEPDPRVVDRTVYRSMERYLDGRRSHVYVVDLADDSVERLTEGDSDVLAPTWGDAATLYYSQSVGDPDPDDSTAYDIVAHDLDTDTAETVHTTTGWGQQLAATADDRVAFTFSEPDQTSIRQTELKMLDVDAGRVTHPTGALDRTLGYGTAPQWGPDEEQLYFTTPDEGAVALWTVPWDGTGPERVVREDWTSIDGVHVGEDVVAVVQSEWDHPGDLFVTTRGGGERRRLTRVNADYLDERAVSQPEELRYDPGDVVGAAGNERPDDLQGWLLTPPGFDPDEQYPMVVEVHGGPHAMWTTSGTMWHEFQTLAARGYVVFWSNPRGSAGYGESFMSAIERDWGAVTTSDVLAGVETAADRDYVDEKQVFVTGGSFGGFATAWLVGTTDRFEAAVSQRGVYDLTGFYGSTDMAYKLVEGDFDTTPTEEPAFLWERSPTGHAHEVDAPTLLLHSEDDYRTPIATAELFHRILRKHGVETRLVRYPDEGHELSRSGQPGHIVDRIERIARWFDGYSEYHDAPPALERGSEDGLTAGADEEEAAADKE